MTGRTVPEWIGKSPDAKVPPHVRMRHITKRKIVPADYWDLDHIIALCNGGEHRESNLAPALRDHHRVKTTSDVNERARIDSLRKRHMGIKKPRTITRWRRMDGTPVFATRER